MAEEQSFYKQGYDLSINNSRSLLDIAIIAAQKGKFGIACSLNILAAEEAAKASFLRMKYYFPTVELEDYNKVFEDHKTKHQYLKLLMASRNVFLKQLEKVYRSNSGIFEQVESFPPHLKNRFKTQFSFLYEGAKWIEQERESVKQLDKIFQWLEQARFEKNKGFYVDEVNDSWSDPQSFSQLQFDTEKKYTERLLEFLVKIEFNEVPPLPSFVSL